MSSHCRICNVLWTHIDWSRSDALSAAVDVDLLERYYHCRSLLRQITVLWPGRWDIAQRDYYCYSLNCSNDNFKNTSCLHNKLVQTDLYWPSRSFSESLGTTWTGQAFLINTLMGFFYVPSNGGMFLIATFCQRNGIDLCSINEHLLRHMHPAPTASWQLRRVKHRQHRLRVQLICRGLLPLLPVRPRSP